MKSEQHTNHMETFQSAGLYLATSQNLSAGRSTVEIVRSSLAGGLKLLQLREKTLADDAFLSLAEEVRELTTAAGALLIINDRLDVALACGADGVHLGQEDLPIAEARSQAPDMIIGASSHHLDEALEAQARGASYVNIGPVFATQTKQHVGAAVGLEAVQRIGGQLTIPFTVMGGIKARHIPGLLEAGARTIAVVTAVTAADDPEQATRDLLAVIRG